MHHTCSGGCPFSKAAKKKIQLQLRNTTSAMLRNVVLGWDMATLKTLYLKKKDVYCWLCWEGVHENCIKLWNCFDKESLQSKSTAGLDNQVSWGYGNTIPIAFLCVIYLRMLVITCHTTAQTGKHWKALLDMSHLPTLSTPAQNFWNHERWRYEHELPGVQRHGMLGASCASTSLVVIVWHNFNLVGINASKEQINTSAISWQGN